MWVVAGVSLLVGSVASALSFYIVDASRVVEHALYFSSLHEFFEALPYIWLVLVAVGLFYTLYAFRHTKKGYRFHPTLIVGVAVVVSVLLGGFLHMTGLTYTIDRYLLSAVPSYGPLAGYKPGHWMSVEDGLLVGHVMSSEDDVLVLRDLYGDTWTVPISDALDNVPMFMLEAGMPVRMWGTTTGEGFFEAHDVRPWRGRGPGPGMGPGTGPRGMMRGSRTELHMPSSLR